MQPILLSRFRELLLLRGETAKLAPETLLASNGRDELFYVPFEYVNRSARLVIVGITPGPNQIAEAYRTVRARLRAGADDDAVLREAKRIGSFGSPTMRPNLVKMLDAMGFPELLGLRSSAELWEEAFGLLHATSVIPHAAFRNGDYFSDSFDEIERSDVFRRGFEEHFVPSLASLPRTALYLALGPTPLAALKHCAAAGHLSPDQIIGALAHPSRGGGSAVDVYLGRKTREELTEGDPVAYRFDTLRQQSSEVRAAMLRLGVGVPLPGGESPSKAPPVVPRTPRAAAKPTGDCIPPISKTGDFVDPERRAAFERAGYDCTKDTVKRVALFTSGTSRREVYLVNNRADIIAVVHPDLYNAARAAAHEPGSRVNPEWFHHSNLRTFPKRQNEGKGEIHFGSAVTCRTLGALEEFLRAFDRA